MNKYYIANEPKGRRVVSGEPRADRSAEDELPSPVAGVLEEGGAPIDQKWYHLLKYLFIGLLFGIVFTKAEIISWFRIQEMFRFQSFHMYGVIGSAVAVAMLSVFLLKKYKIKTIQGRPITFSVKTFHRGQVFGGLIFGAGWAVTGACPGPLFAQIGTGATVIAVTLLSAIAGTWVYGYVREKLPH